VSVADTREAPPQLAALLQELPGVRFVAGPLAAELLPGRAAGSGSEDGHTQGSHMEPGAAADAFYGRLSAAVAAADGRRCKRRWKQR
jgi:hypothetical protein